jgi:hypothetical protein
MERRGYLVLRYLHLFIYHCYCNPRELMNMLYLTTIIIVGLTQTFIIYRYVTIIYQQQKMGLITL